jgi:hypothetical protein
MRRTPSLFPHQLHAYATHEHALAEAVAHRLGTDVDEDPYPLTAAAVIMTALRITVDRWLDTPDTPSLREPLELMIAQLAAGFSAPVRSTVDSG